MSSDSIGPITYTACRFMVSTILLYSLKPFLEKHLNSEINDSENFEGNSSNASNSTYQLWLWGSLSGIANFGAQTLMQMGLVSVEAGKAGFITGMYVVFIPVVEYFLPGYGVHLTWKSWLAAGMCLFGLYLISGCAEQSICFGGAFQGGEALLVGCMWCWVIAIMIDDVGAKRLNVLSLCCVNFFVCTILTTALAIVVEPEYWYYPFNGIVDNLVMIFTLGVTFMIAFCCTTLGQMYVAPARASLLMSLESLSCVLCGYIFLKETLTYVELGGCVFMFVAAIVSSNAFDNSVSTDSNSSNSTENDNTGDIECTDNPVCSILTINDGNGAVASGTSRSRNIQSTNKPTTKGGTDLSYTLARETTGLVSGTAKKISTDSTTTNSGNNATTAGAKSFGSFEYSAFDNIDSDV